MNAKHALSLVLIGAALGLAPGARGDVAAQDKPQPQVKLPESGVPQVITMEGKFVRAAYNNEGYVIIGYQPANRSIGEDWLLIDVGITVRDGVKNYTMKREAFSLETPDGKTHPLPTIEEQRKGNTQALQNRERVQRDSINYFPPSASRACAMTFFPDLTSRAMPQDDVELSQTRACLGRLFFHVPGGIQYGQQWLNVKFEQSLIRVPFRILTKDEEKFFSKNYKSIEKQVEEAFKPKKK
jgi:hypothetical protein